MWLEAARPTTGVLGRNGTVVDEEAEGMFSGAVAISCMMYVYVS